MMQLLWGGGLSPLSPCPPEAPRKAGSSRAALDGRAAQGPKMETGRAQEAISLGLEIPLPPLPLLLPSCVLEERKDGKPSANEQGRPEVPRNKPEAHVWMCKPWGRCAASESDLQKKSGLPLFLIVP